MGKLDEIRNKLQSGTTTRQLIEQGYSRSSVYLENKKLKVIQSDTPGSPVSDEIQELRRHKEIVKLQKEIAELETGKEKLPEQVAALGSRLTALESWCDGDLVDAVGDALYAAWRAADRSKEDAAEVSRIKKAELKRKA